MVDAGTGVAEAPDALGALTAEASGAAQAALGAEAGGSEAGLSSGATTSGAQSFGTSS